MVSRLRHSPDAVAQRVGDEIVLVHLKTDRIFALNETGARIWELLGDSPEPEALERLLQQEFDVDEAQLARELEDLLAALEKESFIESSDL